MILMVASFENFLKEAMEERLNELSASRTFQFKSLPDKIIHHNYKHTFQHSLTSKKFDSLKQKIISFERASSFVSKQEINPEAFSIAVANRSNPKSERLNEFFGSVGHKNFFEDIKPKFEQKTGTQISAIYIQGTLDAIIDERNLIAHTAKGNDLSHKDHREYIFFLKKLSEICDEELLNTIITLNK